MRLTLVRHGEVEERYLGCYNGHIDIGLSPRGEREAKALAAHFKGRTFDAVYCSDLLRARGTLDAFKLNVTPHFSDALREKSWGRHEGMNYGDICMREKIVFTHFEEWISFLDGETHDDFAERVRRFFLEELAVEPHDEVLVMTHAGVIRTLYAMTQSLSLEAAFSLPFPYGAYVTYDLETNTFGEVRCDF